MAGTYHHGNTPAAWTAVSIIFIGFTIGGVYTVLAQPWGVAAGVVVVALGGVVGLVMRSMGLGQPTTLTSPETGTTEAGRKGVVPGQAKPEPETERTAV
jgi:hypothetical protein